MNSDNERLIVAAINDAEKIQNPVVDIAQSHKPRLLIEHCDPERTVSALFPI